MKRLLDIPAQDRLTARAQTLVRAVVPPSSSKSGCCAADLPWMRQGRRRRRVAHQGPLGGRGAGSAHRGIYGSPRR